MIGQEGVLDLDYNKFSERSRVLVGENEDILSEFGFELMDEGSHDYLYRSIYLERLIDGYLEAYEDYASPQLAFRLGFCYIHSRARKKKALKYFKEAYEANNSIHEDILYYLGMSYQVNEEVEKAIEVFREYVSIQGRENLGELLNALIIKRIAECRYAYELMKKKVKVRIFNLGKNINSKYDEHSPLIAKERKNIYYTSTRPIADQPAGFENIYHAKGVMKNVDGKSRYLGSKWAKGVPIMGFYKPKSYTATSAISSDGLSMILYREGNLFSSELVPQEGWSNPIKLSRQINSKQRETSSGLSPDGQLLFFIRENHKEKKGKDIYVASWNSISSSWGSIQNIGPLINTPYDEESVFMTANGTMYFSSKGHNTMGGYDIFKTTFNSSSSSFSKPENMGYPINTVEDDIGLIVDSKGEYGYYATFKEGDGFGERDIYGIKFLGERNNIIPAIYTNVLSGVNNPRLYFEGIKKHEIENKTFFKGVVLSSETEQPIKATLQLYDLRNQLLVTQVSTDDLGKFLIALPERKNYGVIIRKKGYLYFSENINVPLIATQSIEKTISLQSIKEQSNIIMNNVFYKYNSSDLEQESYVELVELGKLLEQNPTIHIELSAHSDSRGSNSYNKSLSERRAKSCASYLTDNFKISPIRIKHVGYGEEKLKVTDSQIKSLATEEEREAAHKKNRRTEVLVTKK